MITYATYNANTLRPLLSGHPRDLIKVGRLIEIQYKLDRNDSKHDFIDSI